MVWYTYRIERLLAVIVDKNLVAFHTAGELEIALVNQKGFVSYYFLDGDPDWLRQLGEYRQIFKERLDGARLLIENERQRDSINNIAIEYDRYINSKDRVIAYYKTGKLELGAKLHKKVRNYFFRILQLCEEYKNLNMARIMTARKNSHAQAEKLRLTAGTAIFVEFFLAVFLIMVLIRNILDPVRRLALETERDGNPLKTQNEIKALSRSVRGLLENVDQTQSELEKSREHLLQAEKMAMVGKLAAGMAHSIRNPFTSVKMRLFSLNRSLNLTETQKDDYRVISEEINHIDTVVQNFLEFSRPPKLKMQMVSPSVVVDSVIQLLEHRLKSYDVSIKVVRNGTLPEIEGDPEQLKEVLVNLVINACEAMEKKGSIVIEEKIFYEKSLEKVAVLRLSDTGPGIPKPILDKIFQPFFTTKEEGTGLGLSIASRIIEEHKGRLEVISTENEGATFIITLPLKGLL